MEPTESFNQGIQDALRAAQEQANREGRSIRVPGEWVNPSSAALAKRPKDKNEKA